MPPLFATVFRDDKPATAAPAVEPPVDCVSKDCEAAVEADDAKRLPDGSIFDEDELHETSVREAEAPLGTAMSVASLYGKPLDAAALEALMPPGENGIVWHAQVVNDSWRDAKECAADGSIKPRRPMLTVRAGDFFSSIARLSDGRWVFIAS
jgi:hypothetical protein